MSTSTQGWRTRIARELFTYCAFWIAVSALPALAISYVVVRVSQHLWLKLLSSRYPGLEFIRNDTVRSLLDTHRNQGIINVLLSIKGSSNPDSIKQQLTYNVIDRRAKDGSLMFPRLRHYLVSRWGNYAWDTNVPFNIENNFILASGIYRGRPVADNNIQDYISDIVSKYFPSDQPPWQYIIIPCVSTEPKFYVLVRVHHLLLTGKKSLNIGDLLMVEQLKLTDNIAPELSKLSPLAKLFPTPSAIPELWGKINESLSNGWNEFVSEYDPVESPRALKTLPGVFHVAGLVLISGVRAFRELSKRSSESRSEPPITAVTFLAAVHRECKRRRLTAPKILMSPLVTADPRKWPSRVFNLAMNTARVALKLPFRISDEINALKELRNTGQVRRPRTLTWKYAEIAQLWARAAAEAWQGLVESYQAPAKIWTDTIGADDGKRHLLQTVNLCGRKVAAWSKSVARVDIERAAHALGVSSTDIALFAATEALRSFFDNAQSETPDYVLTTARAASEDFLFTFSEGNGKSYKKSQTGGMICLSLPIGATPRRIASVVEEACTRQGALATAWAAQTRCGVLTRAVPTPFAKLTLNLLSRRYAVSYAEIDASINSTQRTVVWGQTIESVVYWRPPQANISMSLTVIQYANTVRLAVMTDARLSPSHTVPCTRWSSIINQLVSKIDQEILRISQGQYKVPTIVAPQEDDEEIAESSQEISTNMLRPPSIAVVSPPPARRRLNWKNL